MNAAVAQHVPRKDSIADKALVFLRSIDGRPVKYTHLADQIEAPVSSIYASLKLAVQYDLMLRLDREDGQYYSLPGCQQMPPWRPPKSPAPPDAKPVGLLPKVERLANEEVASPGVEEEPLTIIASELAGAGHIRPAAAEGEREFRCSMWNNGALEIHTGGAHMMFSVEETDELIAYLLLFRERPGRG